VLECHRKRRWAPGAPRNDDVNPKPDEALA
jgi:hypothetical protein